MNRKKVLSLVLVMVMTVPLCLVAVTPVLTQEPEFFFTTTLIIPNEGYRVLVGQMIANELPKIGIDVNLLIVSNAIRISRLTYSKTHNHTDYDGGGFDILNLGWGVNLQPTTPYIFHSDNIGQSNFYPVDNATLDGIVDLIGNTTDFDQRKEHVRRALEMIVWDIHPCAVLYQCGSDFLMRDNIGGFDTNDTRSPVIEELNFTDGQSAGHGNVNELILAGPTRPTGYMPNLPDFDWSGALAIAPAFSGLIELNSSFNFVPGMATSFPYPVAVRNNHTGEFSDLDPNTATVWELELRENLWWHEGYGYTMADPAHRDALKLDADDVVWYYRIRIDPNGPPDSARWIFQLFFGTDPAKAVHKVDETHIQFHFSTPISEAPDLFYRLFTRTLINSDQEFHFGTVLPQHILDPTFDAGIGNGPGIRADGSQAPDYAAWASADYNLGQRTGGYTGVATVGNGPYVLNPGEDLSQQTVTLTKFEHYYKDSDTTYWQPFVQDRPDKYIYTWIENERAAVTALENGNIDIIEPSLLSAWIGLYVQHKPGIVVVPQLSWSWRELVYNNLHGANDNLNNTYVRLAISHMIPRQAIVDLFNSQFLLGCRPAFAPLPQQSPYFPDSLKPIVYNLTRAIEYMELAGYNMDPYKLPVPAPGFEVLAVFIAMGGMAMVVLAYRRRKRSLAN